MKVSHRSVTPHPMRGDWKRLPDPYIRLQSPKTPRKEEKRNETKELQHTKIFHLPINSGKPPPQQLYKTPRKRKLTKKQTNPEATPKARERGKGKKKKRESKKKP